MTRLTEHAKGVYVIAATPFDDTGAIDQRSISTMVDFYFDTGADGLTILGVMGEAPIPARRGIIALAGQRRPGTTLPAAAIAKVEVLIACQLRRLEGLN
jgi:hypothetical protein